ncbi:CCA tRNA nucleotidyltransferase [Zwartia sp.]|uniref:CCA tRNA nucleotidyltransferase n=1 Tax=Zwartia sp. TaxID=2978004 RepID=UPI003BB040E7
MTIDPALTGLQVYIVGGAVRDALLGRPAGDRDWVVVGATPEEMVERGFIPVGGDFPVFLHPRTKEEYALARTERKSGRGYKGFTFYTGADVTLEEDLKRRDLTINAMAQSMTGVLIDPLNGLADLQSRLFRHVGPAFEEDPVRILRLARFAARLTDFSVAPETLAVCRRMVSTGEVDALVPERVWQELSRGLMSEKPSRMLAILLESGASARVMPEWQPTARVVQLVDTAASLPLTARYALFCLDTDARAELAKRLRVPTECADMARLLPVVLAGITQCTPEAAMSLFEMCDAFRKPERFDLLLEISGRIQADHPEWWRTKLQAVLAVDAGAAAKTAAEPAQIKQVVRAARLAALYGRSD